MGGLKEFRLGDVSKHMASQWRGHKSMVLKNEHYVYVIGTVLIVM